MPVAAETPQLQRVVLEVQLPEWNAPPEVSDMPAGAEPSSPIEPTPVQGQPPTPKKTTKGVQPRSWLRHKWRLQMRYPPQTPPPAGAGKTKEKESWR
jgi:hypothetical protein